MSTFKELLDQQAITDIIVPVAKPEEGFAYPGPADLTADIMTYINGMVSIGKKDPNSDFSAKLEGEVFRGRKMTTVDGEVFIFRRLPTEVWPIEQLGLNDGIKNILMSDDLSKGGFVAIVGRPGQGKSTTCSSIVIERLKRFGGLCLTIEDPAEIALHGQHGKGRCLQIEVSGGEDEYREALRGAMRSYPAKEQTIVYVGEVRDGFAAANLLRSALDGRLVFTTFHAADPIRALERLSNLAASVMGEEEARSLVASSFKMVVHQDLVNDRLKIQVLANTPAVASNIRNGAFSMLSTEANRQQNNLMYGRPIIGEQ